MDTDAHEWGSDLTEVVIGAAFEVANVLGAGFLEKVCERYGNESSWIANLYITLVSSVQLFRGPSTR